MAKVIVGMTMSLDGFINDRKGSVRALYPDLNTLRSTELMQQYTKVSSTGVVIQRYERAGKLETGSFEVDEAGSSRQLWER